MLAPPCRAEIVVESAKCDEAREARYKLPRSMEIYCPSCGYNLRGIPEIRCPECGFGFDRTAVEATAINEFGRRLAIYSAIIIRAAFAAAFALPGLLRSPGGAGHASPLAVAAGLVAAMLIKRSVGRTGDADFVDWLAGTYYVLLAIFALTTVLVLAPSVGAVLAAACLVDAACIWTRGWSRLEYTDKTLPPSGAKRLMQYRVGATTAAFIATSAWLASLLN